MINNNINSYYFIANNVQNKMKIIKFISNIIKVKKPNRIHQSTTIFKNI